jgi:hypothetical protein
MELVRKLDAKEAEDASMVTAAKREAEDAEDATRN